MLEHCRLRLGQLLVSRKDGHPHRALPSFLSVDTFDGS